jgi:hypothetical protein
VQSNVEHAQDGIERIPDDPRGVGIERQ